MTELQVKLLALLLTIGLIGFFILLIWLIKKISDSFNKKENNDEKH